MVAKPSPALCLALSLAGALLNAHHGLAFAPSPRGETSAPAAARISLSSSSFAGATESKKTPEAKELVDANGRTFLPGATVAVAPNRTIRAYQVSKKLFGSFDPASREFVPGNRCLVLAGGLRGQVKKVYDTNEWDRAHPILVKFTKGEDQEGGGGFVLPSGFSMHLDADEIQVMDP